MFELELLKTQKNQEKKIMSQIKAGLAVFLHLLADGEFGQLPQICFTLLKLFFWFGTSNHLSHKNTEPINSHVFRDYIQNPR